MELTKTTISMLTALAMTFLLGCEEATQADLIDSENESASSEYENMEGATANCEFDGITFSIAGGDLPEVHISGLPVESMDGTEKVSADEWETVTRRGVRFSDILDKAEISESDDTPVNCVARDGFDPLRTKLAGDTTLLPTLAFLRDFGYVYVGNPGDKDPLYPEMEGRSLLVDYDVSEDADVPVYLGGTLASIGLFRWKMVEKVDDETFGIIELSPVVE